LGPRRIKVNAVAPGAIETDFGGGRTRDDKNVNAMVSNNTALGRAGLPDDIGGSLFMYRRRRMDYCTKNRSFGRNVLLKIRR
jgi:NAD(P)-dependent dehydrogenase (short-subunit alcohol dehydrogenase family)